jgi:hypothetical protein
MTLSVMTLNALKSMSFMLSGTCHCAECHYAENFSVNSVMCNSFFAVTVSAICHLGDCRYDKCRGAVLHSRNGSAYLWNKLCGLVQICHFFKIN